MTFKVAPTRTCPCVTPTALFVVMPQMRRMRSSEAAAFQGFGAAELADLNCSSDITEGDLLDYVGNAFATTVASAVVACSLLVWDRE